MLISLFLRPAEYFSSVSPNVVASSSFTVRLRSALLAYPARDCSDEAVPNAMYAVFAGIAIVGISYRFARKTANVTVGEPEPDMLYRMRVYRCMEVAATIVSYEGELVVVKLPPATSVHVELSG